MSMKDRIKSVAETSADYGATFIIYGDPGIGKTTAAGTIPGRTLIIDIDGGSQVLRKSKNVDILTIHENMEGFGDLFNEIHEIAEGYDNIVLDNLSELEKYMLVVLAKSGKNEGVPEMGHYQRVQFALRDTCRKLRDLRELGKNVVVNAWSMALEIEQAEGVIKTLQAPMISKKISSELCGLFDIVGYMRIRKNKEGENIRVIELSSSDSYIAKNRYGSPDVCTPDLGKLIDHINNGGK